MKDDLKEEEEGGKSWGRLVKDRSNSGLAITIFNLLMDCAENIVSNNCEILDRIKTRIKYGLRILNGDEDGVR